ncbi:FKBP-type peptidyl-prolyl cis-trans isomerase [Polaribacter porphyrae]|uniref:Peptidyl-prolyl cis-trans isomerase n=1 Tax=Polaribacter porphyrae TaxID=1137780 RepID=A0A2S7WKU7_9FLAO|nr:FKBP-type peptidyl-prolyl cis-trans isomerase [Polaribacter porphyrae]PQJ78203.1 peptidylprolyl isomerase [Polaribacter porphyrae]
MRILKVLVVVAIVMSLSSCNNGMKKVNSLESEIDSVSYAVGLNMGMSLRNNFKEVKKEVLLQGIINSLDSSNFLIVEKDIQKVLTPYFNKKRQEQMKAQKEKREKEALVKYADNKKAGEDFLAANKSKKGVITTDSGLQYIVLKEGKGDTPNPTSKVKIHYHGTNISGKVFDSTVDKNKPYESNANIFIKGFNEALSLMKVGSKYRVFIPQELAYGVQERGQLIKPFSALIFEIELLEILKK